MQVKRWTYELRSMLLIKLIDIHVRAGEKLSSVDVLKYNRN